MIWHQLHTNDAPRAAVHYRELFGWFALPDVDLGALGTHRPFAWRVGESAVGGIADVASRPGVHTHWTFFFDVPSLDASLARIRELGGKVLGPSTLPDGTQVAACDDPQGAAFGLMRRPRKGA